jgi:hypothetical protein
MLADPEFDESGPIDILLGSDFYPHMLQTKEDVIHSRGLPSAISTDLRWIIVGKITHLTYGIIISTSNIRNRGTDADVLGHGKAKYVGYPDHGG